MGSIQSYVQTYFFRFPQIDTPEYRVFVQRFPDSPTVPLALLVYDFLSICIVMGIVVGAFVDDPQVLLEADNDVFQSPAYVLCEGFPRLFDHPAVVAFIIRTAFVAQQSLQVVSGYLGIFAGRFVIQIVDVVAGGAGYDDSIHGVMPVVNAFLAESTLIFQRHFRAEEAFAFSLFPMSEARFPAQTVQSFEAWRHQVIPYIVQSPILFQTIGDASCAGDDVFRDSFLLQVAMLVFLADDVGQ